MGNYQSNGGKLDTLLAPRRNHYYYGKLLDELHFQMEQSYVNRKRWLLNRLSLGAGVLCGLQVTQQDGLVCIQPGVAIDALGREIIVPAAVCVDPWRPTDDCGKPGEPLDKGTLHTVYICLAYHECPADYSPVLISGCNNQETCAPGAIVESYRVLVWNGEPPTLPEPDCEVLTATNITLNERRRLLCQASLGPCPPSDKPCVTLAKIDLGQEVGITIDCCAYRPVLYSNAALLDMILCLAQRLDECCGPAQSLEEPLQVETVEFFKQNDFKLGELQALEEPPGFSEGRGMSTIRVTFNKPVVHTTITAGGSNSDPTTFSFLVERLDEGDDGDYVPGQVSAVSNEATQFVVEPPNRDRLGGFGVGKYRATLFGATDPNASERPVIRGQNQTALDGDRDEVAGGNFVFFFYITE